MVGNYDKSELAKKWLFLNMNLFFCPYYCFQTEGWIFLIDFVPLLTWTSSEILFLFSLRLLLSNVFCFLLLYKWEATLVLLKIILQFSHPTLFFSFQDRSFQTSGAAGWFCRSLLWHFTTSWADWDNSAVQYSAFAANLNLLYMWANGAFVYSRQ